MRGEQIRETFTSAVSKLWVEDGGMRSSLQGIKKYCLDACATVALGIQGRGFIVYVYNKCNLLFSYLGNEKIVPSEGLSCQKYGLGQ